MTHIETHKHYKLIAKAIQVLEQSAYRFDRDHEGIEPRLTMLAGQLNISAHHLQRTFTEWAGISPKQFFHCLQKDHARKLIASGKSILHITHELGISSSSRLHHLMLKFEALTPGEIKTQGLNLNFTIGHTPSPFGEIFICVTNKGINSLEFETDQLSYEDWSNELKRLYSKGIFIESNQKAETIARQIFYSTADQTTDLQLHLRGTPFQLQVWQALMHLPVGHLASYQQIATQIGKPSASRAVGSAIAKNPVAFIVPCHRVIQATGELGQYRWQSERKKALHLWEQGRTTEPVNVA